MISCGSWNPVYVILNEKLELIVNLHLYGKLGSMRNTIYTGSHFHCSAIYSYLSSFLPVIVIVTILTCPQFLLS